MVRMVNRRTKWTLTHLLLGNEAGGLSLGFSVFELPNPALRFPVAQVLCLKPFPHFREACSSSDRAPASEATVFVLHLLVGH
mmetsp:Transcript_90639/g.207405  ORF Transcript_90639/g.207405 Transcript_90639/m.207405 type:complete len:82 (+) Transcript_90639:1600-1845(+)